MKGLLVNIYKTAGQECSNGGVSAYADRAILIGEGIPQIFSAATGQPILKLVKGNLSGTVKIVPLEQPAGKCGPMFGGAYVATSDSRFSEVVEKICGTRFGAVPLHDRFE